jgi:hypothetical protein
MKTKPKKRKPKRKTTACVKGWGLFDEKGLIRATTDPLMAKSWRVFVDDVRPVSITWEE